MKNLSLFLTAVAIVALSGATSQATLLGLHTLDNTGTNAVNGIVGVPVGADALYDTDAAVGTHSLKLNVNGAAANSSYFDMTPAAFPQPDSAYPGTGKGLWTGTMSHWIKSTDTSPLYNTWINRGTGFNLGMYPFGGEGVWYINIAGGGGLEVHGVGTILDGAWHLTTATYNLTTGDSGTGSASFYLDGVLLSTTPVGNTVTSASDLSAPLGVALLGIDGFASGAAKPGAGIEGRLDDAAVWNNRLSDIEAKSLYSLGTDSLDYNAQNAQALFDIYASGVSASVGGTTWQKVASGLAGGAGTLDSDGGLRHLVLDANGGGVGQVPEPATGAMLGLGGLALLLAARRRGSHRRCGR